MWSAWTGPGGSPWPDRDRPWIAPHRWSFRLFRDRSAVLIGFRACGTVASERRPWSYNCPCARTRPVIVSRRAGDGWRQATGRAGGWGTARRGVTRALCGPLTVAGMTSPTTLQAPCHAAVITKGAAVFWVTAGRRSRERDPRGAGAGFGRAPQGARCDPRLSPPPLS